MKTKTKTNNWMECLKCNGKKDVDIIKSIIFCPKCDNYIKIIKITDIGINEIGLIVEKDGLKYSGCLSEVLEQ